MTIIRERIIHWALQHLGYEIPSHRLTTDIMPTLLKRAKQHGFATIEQWIHNVDLVKPSHPYYDDFVDILTTNESSFFRQEHQLRTIARHAKQLHQRLKRDIRIWCAGCSSGEEAYSLLFLLDEYVVPCQIVATDIHTPSLQQARQATQYPRYRARKLSPQQLNTFFVVRDEFVDVAPKFRNRIEFREHNLLHAPPRLQLIHHKQYWDFIVCRNVFIYFPQVTVTNIVQGMQQVLEPTGEIWLGVNDSLQGYASFLEKKSTAGIRYFIPKSSQPTHPNSIDGPPTDWERVNSFITDNNWTQALQTLQTIRVHAAPDHVRKFGTQALIHLRQHQFPQAKRLLNQALLHGPQECSLHYFLGIAAHKQHQHAQAKHYLSLAIQYNERFWPAHFLLGQYAHKSNQKTLSLQHFERAQRFLTHPFGETFNNLHPEIVDSVHLNPESVRLLMEHYRH